MGKMPFPGPSKLDSTQSRIDELVQQFKYGAKRQENFMKEMDQRMKRLESTLINSLKEIIVKLENREPNEDNSSVVSDDPSVRDNSHRRERTKERIPRRKDLLVHRVTSPSTVICYNCKNKGHFVRQCPEEVDFNRVRRNARMFRGQTNNSAKDESTTNASNNNENNGKINPPMSFSVPFFYMARP